MGFWIFVKKWGSYLNKKSIRTITSSKNRRIITLAPSSFRPPSAPRFVWVQETGHQIMDCIPSLYRWSLPAYRCSWSTVAPNQQRWGNLFLLHPLLLQNWIRVFIRNLRFGLALQSQVRSKYLGNLNSLNSPKSTLPIVIVRGKGSIFEISIFTSHFNL